MKAFQRLRPSENRRALRILPKVPVFITLMIEDVNQAVPAFVIYAACIEFLGVDTGTIEVGLDGHVYTMLQQAAV